MQKKRTNSQNFWDKEYRDEKHFALSLNHSEDLEKFTRWIVREEGKTRLNVQSTVLDLGCGNGRNIFWLSETFGVRGTGYDISPEAIKQATRVAQEKKLPLSFAARSIGESIPLPDDSQHLVLDMMTSHFLSEEARAALMKEILRVLKPGGYFFYKTFLLDEDANAKRMLREFPGSEPNTYIHPKIGVQEYVGTQEDVENFCGNYFTVLKVYKSHRHTGRGAKRRSIVLYLQKPLF